MYGSTLSVFVHSCTLFYSRILASDIYSIHQVNTAKPRMSPERTQHLGRRTIFSYLHFKISHQESPKFSTVNLALALAVNIHILGWKKGCRKVEE